jgi:hypothetical protein
MSRFIVGAVFCFLIGAGCTHADAGEAAHASDQRPIAAGLTMARAAEAIGIASCEQDLRCGRTGGAQADGYVSRCAGARAEAALHILPIDRCTNGMMREEFAACLVAIRHAPCDTVAAPVRRDHPCSEPVLCLGE